MGDEEDRAQLEEMTEAQREKILYERTERREAMKKRWEIEKVIYHTLSLLKLGMVLVQKNFEFLIFRRGPVMEIFKIPNF